MSENPPRQRSLNESRRLPRELPVGTETLRERAASGRDAVRPGDVSVQRGLTGTQVSLRPGRQAVVRERRRQQAREAAAEQVDFADPDDIILQSRDGRLIPTIAPEALAEERERRSDALRREAAAQIEGIDPDDIIIEEEDGRLVPRVSPEAAAEQREQREQPATQPQRETEQPVDQETSIDEQRKALREEIAAEYDWVDSEDVVIERAGDQLEGRIREAVVEEREATLRKQQRQDLRETVAADVEGIAPEDVTVRREDDQLVGEIPDEALLGTTEVDEALAARFAARSEFVDEDDIDVELTDEGAFRLSLARTPPELRQMLRGPEIGEAQDILGRFEETTVRVDDGELVGPDDLVGGESEQRQALREMVARRYEVLDPEDVTLEVGEDEIDVGLTDDPAEIERLLTTDPQRAQEIYEELAGMQLPVTDEGVDLSPITRTPAERLEYLRETDPEQFETVTEQIQEDVAADEDVAPEDVDVSVEDGEVVAEVPQEIDREIPADAIREPEDVDPVDAITEARDIPDDAIRELQGDPALGDEYLAARRELQEQDALRDEALESGIDDEDALVAVQLDEQTDVVDITAQDVDVTGTRVEDGETVYDFELSESAQLGLVAEEHAETIADSVDDLSGVESVEDITVEDGQVTVGVEAVDLVKYPPEQFRLPGMAEPPESALMDAKIPVNIGETQDGEVVSRPDFDPSPLREIAMDIYEGDVGDQLITGGTAGLVAPDPITDVGGAAAIVGGTLISAATAASIALDEEEMPLQEPAYDRGELTVPDTPERAPELDIPDDIGAAPEPPTETRYDQDELAIPDDATIRREELRVPTEAVDERLGDADQVDRIAPEEYPIPPERITVQPGDDITIDAETTIQRETVIEQPADDGLERVPVPETPTGPDIGRDDIDDVDGEVIEETPPFDIGRAEEEPVAVPEDAVDVEPIEAEADLALTDAAVGGQLQRAPVAGIERRSAARPAIDADVTFDASFDARSRASTRPATDSPLVPESAYLDAAPALEEALQTRAITDRGVDVGEFALPNPAQGVGAATDVAAETQTALRSVMAQPTVPEAAAVEMPPIDPILHGADGGSGRRRLRWRLGLDFDVNDAVGGVDSAFDAELFEADVIDPIDALTEGLD